MKDYLQDLIHHTHGLGVIDLVKVTGTDKQTTISAIADDKTVVVEGTFNTPVADFLGTFGIPNLAKVKGILSLFDADDKAFAINALRNKDDVLTDIHFTHPSIKLNYNHRLMAKTIVEEKVKNVTFKGAAWNVEFEPTVEGIMWMKKMSALHSEEQNFITKTDKGELKICFGDPSSHRGDFVFQSGVSGTLSRAWQWPVKVFIGIMDLTGDKTIRISDQGAAEITVDSGLATYRYLLPAQAK